MSERLRRVWLRADQHKGLGPPSYYKELRGDFDYLRSLLEGVERPGAGDAATPLTWAERQNPAYWMLGKSEMDYLAMQRRYELTIQVLEDRARVRGDKQIDLERALRNNKKLEKELAKAHAALGAIGGRPRR